MLTCTLMGGLGNQLFIIFNVLSQAIKKNQPFCFIKTDTLGGEYCTKRNTYWNTLFAALQPHLVNSYAGQSMQSYKESAFHYTPIFTPLNIVIRQMPTSWVSGCYAYTTCG